jgi:hypothetical protein
MNVKVGRDDCGRWVPPDFQRRLDEFNRTQGSNALHLIYNPTGKWVQKRSYMPDGTIRPAIYEPRWEIWVEWDDITTRTQHFSKFPAYREWFNGVIVRIGPYEYPDGSYADPFNEGFFTAARIADNARTRGVRHSGRDAILHDRYGTAEDHMQWENKKLGDPIKDAMHGSWDYYNRLDCPMISVPSNIK